MSLVSEISGRLAETLELLRASNRALYEIEGILEHNLENETGGDIADVMHNWTKQTVDIHRQHAEDRSF